MAAEVRSWILEVGSKREQVVSSRTETGTGRVLDDLGRYLVAARVVQARQTVLSSSGPLAFVQAEPVGCSTDDKGDEHLLRVMAMGAPRSRPDSCQLPSPNGGAVTVPVRAGDLMGIHRGLAWEVELVEFQRPSTAHGLQPIPLEQDHNEDRKQRWLVAMEWDLIRTTT